MLLSFPERRWWAYRLGKAASFDLLRVNPMASVPDGRGGVRFHVDTLDPYSARARASFLVAAAAELGISEDVAKRDLGRVLLVCEQLADQVVTDAQTPIDEPTPHDGRRTHPRPSPCCATPKLVSRIVVDSARAGVVGEATNCLVGYLTATSRNQRPHLLMWS